MTMRSIAPCVSKLPIILPMIPDAISLSTDRYLYVAILVAIPWLACYPLYYQGSLMQSSYPRIAICMAPFPTWQHQLLHSFTWNCQSFKQLFIVCTYICRDNALIFVMYKALYENNVSSLNGTGGGGSYNNPPLMPTLQCWPTGNPDCQCSSKSQTL